MVPGHITGSQSTVNQWLKNLGGGQVNLELDAAGCCHLVTQQGINMMISCGKDSRQLILLSELLNLPIPLSSHLYEELLSLNLNVELTAGAQIYFDKRARVLGLLFSRDINTIDEIGFNNLLGNFQEKVLELKDLIDALVFGASVDHGTQLFGGHTKNPSTENSWSSV